MSQRTEKVNYTELVEGKEYWLDNISDCSGIYKGRGVDDDNSPVETLLFERTSGRSYTENKAGYIDFAIDGTPDYYYEK
jgi:hypothetical protein